MTVLRASRLVLTVAAVLLAGGTILLAFLSFARKVETFTQAGFASVPRGGELVVTTVEEDGAAARAGIAPGDRILLADGRMATAIARPEMALARKPFPHHLVVRRGETDIHEVRLDRPQARIDKLYLFLAFVGFLYLLIGLFTVGRNRSRAAWVFLALCLASFAVYVITPSGSPDLLFRASWFGDAFFRALLPALLLHVFLVFPTPVARRGVLALLYAPAVAYLAGHLQLLGSRPAVELLTRLERLTELWYAYFAIYAAAVLVRLVQLFRRRADAVSEKQVRWMGLGVAVGLTPFLLLSVVPRAFGLSSPLLSSVAVLSLVVIPLAFSYAILKWRLWDVETFMREALATTASVVLGGMTFVLLNTLLDRTFGEMAEAGKNVVAFGSGLVLASLLVPMKKRITGVLEKIQYHDTYRSRRALLDIARDFATPRTRGDLARAIVKRVEDGLHVVPCTLFLFEEEAALPGEDRELLSRRLEGADLWRLRGAALGEAESAGTERLHARGYRAFFALRSGAGLMGALGVGHKDGRNPLSSEDEALLSAVMAQAGLAYENARLYGALAERLEEIRSLQQYQESVIRSSSSGIVVLDRENRVQSANPAFAAMIERTEAELTGGELPEILPEVEPATLEPAEPERTVEIRWKSPSGEERDLRLSVAAFQGDPDRRVLVVDDVTDRVRAERALAERERLAALGVLAAGVAHEVNTPIAGLSSYAQILLADTSPADPRYPILKKMERQTFRAAHLVNNLLEFARPRARTSLRTDLRDVLANASESVETAFGARGVRLETEPTSDPVWVDGDPRDLEQVLVNLLTNARDASPDGGTVRCGIAPVDGKARVVVADRGAGISPEAGEKLFQPFYTTKKSGGTGLGLAISREIVRRHGGDIGLAARAGGGTEAWVELPLAEAGE